MDQKETIEFAVEEAIADCRANSPAAPSEQVDVVVDMAATNFNSFVEENSIQTDIDSRSVLEVKLEVETERQLDRGN